MRFLHTADLHLGKTLSRFSLIKDQAHILGQIMDIACAEHVDGLLLAGDIFDRSVPPLDAVKLLDSFLTEAVRKGLAVFMISGNHDSQIRLAFGSTLMADASCWIAAEFTGDVTKVRFEKNGEVCHVHLLPYVKSSQLAALYPEDGGKSSFADLMARFMGDAGTTDPGGSEATILLAHQWLAGEGGEGRLSESEIPAVGMVEVLPSNLFRAYDYVALGHLHRPQNPAENMRYAGSPLAYSASEAGQEKSVVILDVTGQRCLAKRVPLKPLRRVRIVQGALSDFICGAETDGREDYVFAELSDPVFVTNALARLHAVWPNLCRIRFSELEAEEKRLTELDDAMRTADTAGLFKSFFREETGRDLTACQEAMLNSAITTLRDLDACDR